MGIRAAGFFVTLALVSGAMINMAMAQSGARGDGHAQHHDMYKDWQRPEVGGSCCNAQSSDDPPTATAGRPRRTWVTTAYGGRASSQARAAS
jgi:hypothetical protein